MTRWLLAALLLLVPSPVVADATRGEITHPGSGHDVHLSPPAIAADREGPLVAWMAKDGHDNVVYLARPGGARTRVSPAGWSGESLHQAPGLAVGPGGEIYVTWASARRPKPADALFVSDLQLSRSLDGGKSFGPPLRVTDDTPTSHSFEGVAVAPDGTVLVAWIETRPGAKPRTYLARIGERGSRVDGAVALDADETCVCCRVAVAADATSLAVLWRKVFPGDVRDMVIARSRDGGRTFGPAARVHADDWRITACPHRGGSVALDARGRAHAVWYTEGKRNEPDVLYAIAADGQRFGAPKRVHVSAASIPDHARLAVRPDGRAVIVWEDATAVRRRVLLREATGGSLGPVRVLSQAVKAYAPDITLATDGEAVIAWHEERFPSAVTVITRLGTAPGSRGTR